MYPSCIFGMFVDAWPLSACSYFPTLKENIETSWATCILFVFWKLP